MRCPDCRRAVEVVKQRIFRYEGVGVEDLYLLNVEIKVCTACDLRSPILRNMTRLHAAIGEGLALQPSRLKKDEMRFLRRSCGARVMEWAQHLGINEATYSRFENDHQAIGEQAERLGRLQFVYSASGENATLQADMTKQIIDMGFEAGRDYVVAIDVDDIDLGAVYISKHSPLLASPKAVVIEVPPAFVDSYFAKVILEGGSRPARPPVSQSSPQCQESNYVRDAFALAA